MTTTTEPPSVEEVAAVLRDIRRVMFLPLDDPDRLEVMARKLDVLGRIEASSATPTPRSTP